MDTCNKQETLPPHETPSHVRTNATFTNENRDKMPDVNAENAPVHTVTGGNTLFLNSNTLYDALPIDGTVIGSADLDVISAKCTDTTSIKDDKQTNSTTNVTQTQTQTQTQTKNMNHLKSPQSKLVDYGMSDSEDSNSDSDESLSDSETTSDNEESHSTKPNDPEQSAVRNNTEFRENVSSSDSTSEYESDSSTSFSDIGACGVTLTPSTDKKRTPDKMKIPRTKGELTLDQLPPIEELKITVPEEECIEVGVVTSIIDQLVIVQSVRGTPACDIDTLFFLNRGSKPLGRVFDVLGPVSEPLYAIRFNSYEQALEAGVKPGTPVYCAPRTSHTSYVFVSELMNKRIERVFEKSIEKCCDNMEHLNLNNNNN